MLVEYDDLVLVCLCGGGVMANFIWYISRLYTLFPYGLYRASFDDLWESVVSCVCFSLTFSRVIFSVFPLRLFELYIPTLP